MIFTTDDGRTARRVVRLRDGAVESDTAVVSPRLGALFGLQVLPLFTHLTRGGESGHRCSAVWAEDVRMATH